MEKRSNTESGQIGEAFQAESVGRFRTQFTPSYIGAIGEVNELPSETVPDMSLTIHELLTNHTRGMGTGIRHMEGEYFEDTEIPRFDDLTDMVAYKQDLVDRARELEQRIEEEKKNLKDKVDDVDASTQKPSKEGTDVKGTLPPDSD